MKKLVILAVTLILLVCFSYFIYTFNYSSDNSEVIDSDGDGIPNEEDAFPDNPAEWLDSDGDGVGDDADAFPYDPSEWIDSDGDGVGDNSDEYPNDPTESADTDNDGIGDKSDINPEVNLGITIMIKKFKVTGIVDWFLRAQVYFEIKINQEDPKLFDNNGMYWRVWSGSEQEINLGYFYDIPDNIKDEYTTIEVIMYDHDLFKNPDLIDISSQQTFSFMYDHISNTVSVDTDGVVQGKKGMVWYEITLPKVVVHEETFDKIYRWMYNDNNWELPLDIPVDIYNSYKNSSINRNPKSKTARASFVTYHDTLVQDISTKLEDLADIKDFTLVERVNFILRFVQKNIKYTLDNKSKDQIEYWRFPVETLVDQVGDCEDTAVLFSSIVKNLGYDIVLLFYSFEIEDEQVGHLAVGIHLEGDHGEYEIFKGKRYFYCETAYDPIRSSDGYNLGEVPDELTNGELYQIIEIL